MNIEEKIFELYSQIKKVENEIDRLEDLDYTTLHKYIDELFILKKELQKLENDSYLERQPDIESDEIDLYLKNLHDKNEEHPDKLSYIITLHNTKTRIGIIDVRFFLLSFEKYLGNIGANIEEAYRGKRYSKKAFTLLKDVMLEQGLKKPIFTVLTTNISSIKSLDAIGAKRVKLVDTEKDPYYVYEYNLEEEAKTKK